MSQRLDNYLRSYRRRAGLSQEEMAFLLGGKDGAKVCRHERFARTPTIETAFAYEIVFGVVTSELFAGIYDQVERKTLRRVKTLLARVESSQGGRLRERKLALLREALNARKLPSDGTP